MTEDIQKVNVKVAGGYNPAIINLKKGIPAEITFTRTNTQGCLDIVHSQTMNFEKKLPLNVGQTVSVDTSKIGEYEFSCGMDMFSGKVVIQ